MSDIFNITCNSHLVEISRTNFIDFLFDKSVHNFDYLIFLNSVLLADSYVKIKSIYIDLEKTNKYSEELAFSTLIISIKLFEDNPDRYIHYLLIKSDNRYIFELERKICKKLNYNLIRIKILNSFLNYFFKNEENISFNKMFNFLFRDLSKIDNFQNINPFTIILAFILLYRNNKLSAFLSYKINKFEYQLYYLIWKTKSDFSPFINKYIEIKK